MKALKKTITFLMALLLSLAPLTMYAANGTFGGGNGTSVTPYIIEDAADLDAVRNDLSANYKLSKDIDLSIYLASGVAYSKQGNEGWCPIGDGSTNSMNSYFTGSFNGDGHKITGLWIVGNRLNFVGLFGETTNATIENLGVEIDSRGVEGTYQTGGLVAVQDGGSIKNCYSTGDVNGGNGAGGLVGTQLQGNIENCYTTGNSRAMNNAGGLVGYQSVGGNINNCYTTGNVSGNSYIGGLVGYQLSGNVRNCYATGNVSGSSYVGGLVGLNFSGEVSNCFFDIQTTGQEKGIGGTSPNEGVAGKTTAEMQRQATFAGWDFTNVWGIHENSSYPYLKSLITGISSIELQNFNFTAYPNPVAIGQTLYVKYDVDNEQLKDATIEVYNMAGNIVDQLKVQSRFTPIHIKYASGAYFFVLKRKGEFLKNLKVIVY